jgi:hypothetical protein
VGETQWQNRTWGKIDARVGADLSNAKGAYVYSLRHGERHTPLYVGLTNKGFRSEVFASHNRERIYHHWKYEKGAIVVHLLAKPKRVQKGFSRNIPKDWLSALEALLIFVCRRNNKKLSNKKHTKWLDGIGIAGITGVEKRRGKPPKEIQTFKKVLKW